MPLPQASVIDDVLIRPPVSCARKETDANLCAEARVLIFEKLEKHNHLQTCEKVCGRFCYNCFHLFMRVVVALRVSKFRPKV